MSGVTDRLSPLFTWRSAIAEAKLSATTKAVAYALSLHMNERGGSCFPSIPTIAAESGASESTVRRALFELEYEGLLSVRRGGGRSRSNTYTATIPKGCHGDTVLDPGKGCHGDTVSAEKGVTVTEKGVTVTPESVIEDVEGELKTSSPSRARNLLFEELVLAWRGHGETTYTAEMAAALTDSARGEVNRARKELSAIGATPSQIRERAAEYRRQHPDWTFSPSAFAKWWGTLESKRERLARRFG